jgi:hypothetical protein
LVSLASKLNTLTKLAGQLVGSGLKVKVKSSGSKLLWSFTSSTVVLIRWWPDVSGLRPS